MTEAVSGFGLVRGAERAVNGKQIGRSPARTAASSLPHCITPSHSPASAAPSAAAPRSIFTPHPSHTFLPPFHFVVLTLTHTGAISHYEHVASKHLKAGHLRLATDEC